jgi:hypothetical protein
MAVELYGVNSAIHGEIPQLQAREASPGFPRMMDSAAEPQVKD